MCACLSPCDNYTLTEITTKGKSVIFSMPSHKVSKWRLFPDRHEKEVITRRKNLKEAEARRRWVVPKDDWSLNYTTWTDGNSLWVEKKNWMLSWQEKLILMTCVMNKGKMMMIIITTCRSFHHRCHQRRRSTWIFRILFASLSISFKFWHSSFLYFIPPSI